MGSVGVSHAVNLLAKNSLQIFAVVDYFRAGDNRVAGREIRMTDSVAGNFTNIVRVDLRGRRVTEEKQLSL